jgi:hypothetical protein
MPNYQTLKKNVKLGAGQKLGYTAGKGYYALGAVAKPLTIKQQAIEQVNAVNQAGMTAANQAGAKAISAAKQQAAQALGFQHALADITQGDAGRIYDAYGNAADKVSAYGNLALASTGDSSRSAAAQAQNYLGTVGPDVGAETRPDIAGALRALGATSVGDPAGALKSQGAYAQERQQSVRDAQLMRLADIGANATYQGVQTANQLRSDEIARASGSRAADVNAAVAALKEEARLSSDQSMKKQAFAIELQQKKVDLAAAKLANATGAIAKKQAQFELDNAQKVLNSTLAGTAATTANVKANTAATKAEIKAAEDEKKANPKGLTPYQQTQAISKAHDAAALFYNPPPPKSLTEKQQPRLPYQDALKRLTGKFGLTKAQGVEVLNTYYKEAGADGRPVFDFTERAQLAKLGYTKAQIQQAMTGYIQSKRTGKPSKGYKLYEKMLDRLG